MYQLLHSVSLCRRCLPQNINKSFIEYECISEMVSSTPTSLPVQVDSTASHNAALTADGELLTWSCTAAIARLSIPPSILDRSRNVQQWRPESRVDRGCPAMDDAVCTCSRCHSSSVCPTSGENAEDPTTPMVWQVLACKPSVTDVACGQKHTLALLETGQVRLKSHWGRI